MRFQQKERKGPYGYLGKDGQHVQRLLAVNVPGVNEGDEKGYFRDRESDRHLEDTSIQLVLL